METKKGRLFGNTQTETLVRHHIDCPKHHRDSVRRSSVENKSTVPGSFEYILHRMIEEHGPLPKCTTPALTDGLLQRSGPLAGFGQQSLFEHALNRAVKRTGTQF